ncbi:MAG: peptidoglycan DD-metalloendopeptidase family protein [Rhodobacterales bacterium]|nr:peptidoglycan DD-metalloendopeptidase family protein [Rhodobacterales bacterium]
MQLMEPPEGLPFGLLVLCSGSLLLNVVLLGALFAGGDAPPEAVAQATPVEEIAAPDDAVVAAIAEEVAPVAAPIPEGLSVIHADVSHSLARTFQTVEPERADVISAIYARLFVWDLDLRRDLQKGDQIALAYEWDGELAEIPVASYKSKKLGKTLKAYRFMATGDDYASWWDAEGVEVPHRLKVTPLNNYQQVTSLLKDRPTHKGMDFKVEVGTDVVSPKAGTVVRTDWNFKYNGNCAEVKFDDGTLARFLHLSNTVAQPGQRLSAGAVVGLSGNTGRSTAPHLHYELEKAGQVVDPVTYHGTRQRELGAADLEKFLSQVPELDRLLERDT